MVIMITPFSGLPRHRKQSRRTIPGRTGFYIAGAAASPKKPISPREGLFGRDRHPKECDCQRKRREMLETADRERKHREEVERLKESASQTRL